MMSISQETGEDRSYTKYIIIGASLITLTVGIVCIKKFIL